MSNKLRHSNRTQDELMANAQASSTTRVLSVTSGKGGVGKTHTVANLAIALANSGKSVLILDADLSLANIDVMLGIEIRSTLQHFFSGQKSLEEIIVTGPAGISIIPAASGVESICSLEQQQRAQLVEAIEEIAWKFDYLLIDTPAGIGSDVLFFNSASTETAVVISSDPTSLTDAYALMKVLSRNYGERQFRIIVNNVRSEYQAKSSYRRLSRAVQQFLSIKTDYLGYVPTDDSVHDAVQARRSVVLEYPSSRASRSLVALAERVDADFHDHKVKGGMQFFFRQLLDVSGYGS